MSLELCREFVRHIYATQAKELDCEGFLEIAPQYVEAEIAGDDANLRFPAARHHLNQCAECHDLYLTLHEVALLENEEVISGPEMYLEIVLHLASSPYQQKLVELVRPQAPK